MAESGSKYPSVAQKHYELVQEYKGVLDAISATAAGAKQAPFPLIKYGGKIVGLATDVNGVITPLLVNKPDEVAGALGGIAAGGAALNLTVAIADGLPNPVVKVGVKVVGGGVSAYLANKAGETAFSSPDALPSLETWGDLFVFPEKINGNWYVEINKGGAHTYYGLRYMKEITDEDLVATLDMVERAHSARQKLQSQGVDPDAIESEHNAPIETGAKYDHRDVWDATESPSDTLPRGFTGDGPADVIDTGDVYIDPIDGEQAARDLGPATPSVDAPTSHKVNPALTYTVQPGDSLWKIAEQTGVPFDQVLALNRHLDDPGLIHPGEKINLPESYVDENGFINATVFSPGSAALASASPFDPVDVRESAWTEYDEDDLWDATEGPPGTYGVYAYDPLGADDTDASATEREAGAPTPAGEATPAQQAQAGALQSAYGLYAAIEGGDSLAIVRSGIGAALEFGDLGTEAASALGKFGGGLGAAMSSAHFFDALEAGDTLGAASAGLSAAAQAAHLAGAQFAGTLSSVAGPVGAFAAFAAGDPVGGVGSMLMNVGMSTANPYLIAAGIVLSVFGDSLFGEEEPYEPPTGEGNFYRTEDGEIALSVTGTPGNQADHVYASLAGNFGVLNEELSAIPSGDEIVRVALTRTLHDLQEQMRGDAALIPERLPTLSFNGFFYIATFKDPHTAQSQEIAIARADVIETLQALAYHSEAIVPRWEADTVAARLKAGDPHYWYTEEQRAAPVDGSEAAAFTPIIVDLDGDGRATPSGRAEGVLFDADADGYQEATQWVSPEDALLALDRNLDGQIDNATELFSHPALAAAYRGLGGLHWLDVNKDGVIDRQDPVFDSLRLWQDQNADGLSDPAELMALATAGITSLRYAADHHAQGNGTPAMTYVSAAGLSASLLEATLAAEDKGIQLSHLPGGTWVDQEAADSFFYVTEAIDLGPHAQPVAGPLGAFQLARGDAIREIRALTEAATRSTPFTEATVGLLAFGAGFSNSLAADHFPPDAVAPVREEAAGPTLAPPQAKADVYDLGVSESDAARAVATDPAALATRPPPTNDSASVITGVTPVPATGTPDPSDPAPHVLTGARGIDESTVTPPAVPTENNTPATVRSGFLASTDIPSANQMPLGGDDLVATLEDTETVIPSSVLLANDVDLDNDFLSITAVANAVNGQVRLDEAGNIRFTPEKDYFGQARFDYTLEDARGGIASATAFLQISPVNDAPVIDEVTFSNIPVPDGFLKSLFERIEAGSVTASDVDDPVDSLTFTIARHPLHGTASISEASTGDWRYISTQCDPYSGADPFVVRVADPHGAAAEASVDVNHRGSECSDGGKKPLVIDLNNDGLDLIGVDDSTVFFDVNHDGWREKTAWAGPADGLLAYDKDADGRITDIDEISFTHYQEGARTDLEGLKAFDTNDDGLFSRLDQRWGEFGVFQDKDQDGITDPGEFRALAEHRITAIGLESDNQLTLHDDGNVVFGHAAYVREDGITGLVGDVMFRYDAENIRPPADPDLTEAIGLPASAADALGTSPPAAPPPDSAEAAALDRLVEQLRADIAAFDPPAPVALSVDGVVDRVDGILGDDAIEEALDETGANSSLG